MDLSIIIPHYNNSSDLVHLLETCPYCDGAEVIVVDDYSSEEHGRELESLQRKYAFKLFYNDGEKSAGRCRNIGLRKAQGKWVFFADSDDFFSNDVYECVRAFFKKTYDVIFFPPSSVFLDTSKTADRHIGFTEKLRSYKKSESEESELALRYRIPNSISKLIRRDFLIDNGIFFDEVIASNDVMFSTKVGHHMRDFFVDESVVYIITRRSGSLTVNMTKEVWESRFKVAVSWHCFLRENLDERKFHLLRPRILINILKGWPYGVTSLYGAISFARKNKVKFFVVDYTNPIHLLKKCFSMMGKVLKNVRYYR